MLMQFSSCTLVNITGTNIFLYFIGNQLQQSKYLIDGNGIWETGELV